MSYIKQGDYKDLIEEVPDGSIDLILTDIPYNISRPNSFQTMPDRKGRTGIDFGEWDKGFDVDGISVLARKLKKGGSLITFHALEQYHMVVDALSDLEVKDRLVWEKTNPMPRNRDRRYISNIEHFTWFVKPGDKWTFNRQHASYDGSVITFPVESGGGYKRYHPCQKNVKLLEELIKRHTNVDDMVLDPFMGSGSTCIAAINTDRRFIGFEIDEQYYNTAYDRVAEATLNKILHSESED